MAATSPALADGRRRRWRRGRGIPEWLGPIALALVLIASIFALTEALESSTVVGRIETAGTTRAGRPAQDVAVIEAPSPAAPAASTDAASGTSTATGPGPTATAVDEVYLEAVWPSPVYHALRYDDPRAAAEDFAQAVAGFEEPEVSGFTWVDGRTGTVQLRPTPGGPITLITLSRLGEGSTWWVTGAASQHLRVDDPPAGLVVGSPVRVAGRASSPTGLIEIDLRADGVRQPIHRSEVVIGDGESTHWFEAQFGWSGPVGDAGVLVVTSRDEAGGVLEVTAVRVRFEPSADG